MKTRELKHCQAIKICGRQKCCSTCKLFLAKYQDCLLDIMQTLKESNLTLDDLYKALDREVEGDSNV